MNVKGLTFLLVLFFSFSLAYASDSCKVSQNCTWFAYGSVGETGVNISFTYNGTTTEEFSMTNFETGKYLYTTIHNETGNVLGCVRSFNSTDTINTECESKEIYYETISASGGSGMSLAPLVLVLGVLAIAGLLLWVTFKLSDEHIFWKIFILGVGMLMLIFIPKATIDANQNCSILPTSTSITGGSTNFNYELVCIESESTTATSFLKVMLWIVRAFFIYTMIYLFIKATNNLKDIPSMIENTFNRRK